MSNRFYSISRDVMTSSEVQRIIEGVCECRYLGKSPLGQEFIHTLGFSIVFRREAVEDVVSHFPFLEAFLEKVIFSECNAFYLNPLVLHASSKVKAHIDCRLLPGGIRVIPNLVSIFYAEISKEMQGGRLILNVGADNQIALTPEANSVVNFLGSTIHCVSRVKNSKRRISLVCEQYNFDEDLLQHFPYCKVITDIDNAPRVSGFSTVP